jgi:alkanesulfonate monooxygenase SsuD/methylene tetrahydromethanopterin reductase-like flavin-dependent oxidoreductase (luciferase family)
MSLLFLSVPIRRTRLDPWSIHSAPIRRTRAHPGRLAKIAATLQEMAQGRFELGIGGGGWKPEQEAFGIDQGSQEEQKRTAETPRAQRALKTNHDGCVVQHAGA